jgi:hypothetical protein
MGRRGALPLTRQSDGEEGGPGTHEAVGGDDGGVLGQIQQQRTQVLRQLHRGPNLAYILIHY